MISFLHNPRKNNRLLKLIISIPIINVLASLATNHEIGIGSFHFGYLRGIILTVLGLYLLFSVNKNKYFSIITVLLVVYTFILCLFSKDIIQSLIIWNKFFISSTLFFAGFYIIQGLQQYNQLLKSTSIAILLILIYILSSNILGFGIATYGDKSITFGETGVNIVKSLGVFLIISPLLVVFIKKKHRKWYLALVLLSIIVLLLGLKRGTILGVTIGFTTFLFFSPSKLRYLRLAPLIIVFLIPLIIIFKSDILSSYTQRVERLDGETIVKTGTNSDESEGRTIELVWVLQRFNDGNITFKLFGEDPLLVRQNALGIRGYSRINHMDFTSVLDSFGLIGFTLFTLWYLCILRYLLKLKRLVKKSVKKEMLAVSLALFFAHIPYSISGTIPGIDLRGLLLLHLGALIALVIRKETNMKKPIIND